MALLRSEIFGVAIADTSQKSVRLALDCRETAVSALVCRRRSLMSERLGLRVCGRRVRRLEDEGVCSCAVRLGTTACWGVDRKRLRLLEVGRGGAGVICQSGFPPGEEIAEKERLRRAKISLANRGKTPWNRGRNHAPETIARIKQRNLALLEDPKFREKLRQIPHRRLNEETKEKIRKSMKATMDARFGFVKEWRETIAGTARAGAFGERQLQWDSYVKLRKALADKYKERVQEKEMMQRKPYKKTWTLEQRTKVLDVIRAKWNDPVRAFPDF